MELLTQKYKYRLGVQITKILNKIELRDKQILFEESSYNSSKDKEIIEQAQNLQSLNTDDAVYQTYRNYPIRKIKISSPQVQHHVDHTPYINPDVQVNVKSEIGNFRMKTLGGSNNRQKLAVPVPNKDEEDRGRSTIVQSNITWQTHFKRSQIDESNIQSSGRPSTKPGYSRFRQTNIMRRRYTKPLQEDQIFNNSDC